jgi:integrase
MPLRATPARHVRMLFDACASWQELLCLSTLAYVGSRRGAVSKLRWRDVDFETAIVTFFEKGGKVIAKSPQSRMEALTQLRTRTSCRCNGGNAEP